MIGPFFVIGASRHGTTLTERLVRMSPDIDDARFVPYARWDFAALAEMGGALPERPVCDRMRTWIGAIGRTALVKLSLPFGYEAFGWSNLLQEYPGARVAFVCRDSVDAWASVCDMPHWQALGNIGHPQHLADAYAGWRKAVLLHARRMLAKRGICVRYEDIVNASIVTTGRIYESLGVTPADPDAVRGAIRLPKHRTVFAG